ncbi:TonB-dependent receptor [Mucilaginibacter gynuensis]|uniref:TonB-dependent receptor n=2 Tax=Mucilaginibacter gynuensis TaxID=1302236 RepID=A0ABP8FUE4_9SPHI
MLLTTSVSICLAQNRVTIKGKIVDSVEKTPLEFATVAVLNVSDSSLISYTLTKKTGEFELHNLPLQREIKLLVSFVSYKSYRKIFNFKEGGTNDLGDIALSTKMMDEVTIKGERIPVMMNKDTIEFNAEAFKTRPNAVVEELLKKLPGVQVNKDGSITVNGKTVSKLLIDGKEFFGNDPKVATRNLDAEVVAQIQVYDDRQNDPDHLVSETKVPKIINIKLKKAIKRSIFGKVFAGGGTRDRYETGGLFNMFRDTLQLSVIGLSNNLNRTAFSNEELYSQGGFNRSGGDALYNGSVNTGGRNWGGGIEKITSGGFNLNTDYGKKLKMNLLYFITERSSVGETSNFGQQFLKNDTTLLSSSRYSSRDKNYSHSVSGLVEWNPDTLRSLRYTPKFTLNSGNSVYDSFGSTDLTVRDTSMRERANESRGNNVNSTNSKSFSQDFYFNKRSRTNKGGSFTISHNLQINPSNDRGYNNNDVISYLPTTPSESQRQLAVNNRNGIAASINLSYRYPITKKLTVDIVTWGNYNRNKEQLLNFKRNDSTERYDILLPLQSSDLTRKQWNEGVKPGITYQLTKKISIIAGLNHQWQQIENNFSYSKLNQRYFFLLPTFRIEAGSFSLSYDKGIEQPWISALQPVTIVYSPLYSYTGNPDLKPTTNTNASLSYWAYNNEKQISFNAYLSYSMAKNTTVSKQTIKSDGAQTSTMVNRDGRPNINGYLSVGKQFKKTKDWQAGVSTSAYAYYGQNLNLLNDVEGWQKNLTMGISENFNVNWKDKVELNVGAGFREADTRYDYDDFKKVYTRNFNLNNSLLVRFPKKIIWETKQDYNYSSQITDGFRKGVNVVSSSLALQMLAKDRGEIKLTVYDVFDQNISVYRYTGTNSVYDTQNNTLKRYFMLTYTYKFNKLSTK